MTIQDKEQIIALIDSDFTTDVNLDSTINICDVKLDRSFFGDKFYYACSLFVQHKLTLRKRPKGASGALTSVSEYGLSMGFSGASFGSYGELSQTSFGLELAELARSLSCCKITGVI